MAIMHSSSTGPARAGDDSQDDAQDGQPRPRLLIVDDISDNRNILARRFQRRGYDTFEADGGERALELIHQQRFDLVLLDVMMPDIDGIEVLKRIRQLHSPVALPVIMVTAKSQSEDIVEALEFDANDYITKPVDFAVALARVNAQIGRKRAEEEVQRANEALRLANESLEQRVSERTARLAESNTQLKGEIEQRQRSEARSRYLAHHDALTGLGNRLLFREELENGLAHCILGAPPLAVLFVDLDGFKSVNDTLGHSIGDALLKMIAGRLRDTLKEGDRIARLGGDEFAIMQTGMPQPAGGVALAERIVELASIPCLIEGHELMVGASVGVVTSTLASGGPEDLLKSADLAMYRAKADGRGTFRLFNPEMDATAQGRRSMEIDLRSALLHGEFTLAYQPLVNLRSKQVTSFEALLRWEHRSRGAISPSEFIPVAEDIGLIVQLGEWVLRQACQEAMGWPNEIKVAVNLSPVQFMRGNLVASVVSALASTGLPASRLELEITESVLLEKTDRNLDTLNQLRELGVLISMDDFGTGYSSLGYLRRFNFDKIKIDQSFVRDLSIDAESRAIVHAIAGLGTSFGIATTAEGVETEDQLRQLNLEGCTEVQGRVYSMPVPAHEVHRLLRVLGQEP